MDIVPKKKTTVKVVVKKANDSKLDIPKEMSEKMKRDVKFGMMKRKANELADKIINKN